MNELSERDLGFLQQIASLYRNVGRGGEFAGAVPSLLHGLCDLCGGPSGTFSDCFKCGQVFRTGQFGELLPDVCAPLFYAISGAQSGQDVYAYKDPAPAQPALRRIKIAVYFFLQFHLQCLDAVTGVAPTHVAAVPSGRGRSPHPLVDVILPFAGRVMEPRSVRRIAPPRADGVRQSVLDPSIVDVGAFTQADHVVVLEDTWTSGASCLSVAVAVRQAGAGVVSVVPFARYMNRTNQATSEWLEAQGELPRYDPAFCPVTRSPKCPSTALKIR